MRRSNFMSFALALLVLCLFTACEASAQQGGRRGMMGNGGGLQMLAIAEVQKELKMTPEQIGKISSQQAKVREDSMALFQAAGGNPAQMSPEDRQKVMDKVQGLQTSAVGSILDATQQKRFKELELQQQGGSALTRKEVQEGLKITDDQKKKMAETQAQGDKNRRDMMQGVDFQNMSDTERATLRTKMMGVQKETSDKLVAVLTDEQKAQWKTMLGTPFTFPAPTTPAGR